MTADPLTYLSGFGNEHSSEALDGALPQGQFSPQKVAYGLYAEKFSSTAFTAPRASNRRTWFYRIRPSVLQGRYSQVQHPGIAGSPLQSDVVPPAPLRWSPFPIPERATDFVDGLLTIAANGSLAGHTGIAIHLYLANQSMRDRYFVNADGELLIVPQHGALIAHTECGILHIAPGEICVIPRGMKFRIELPDGNSRGYVCENYGAPLELPERGPVGSDGFANDRDFLTPCAAYEDREGHLELMCKFMGQMYSAPIGHSPLDAVAWVGTSVPYKYDLNRFMTIGTVSFDHPDPSIFTVLTSPSDTVGVANVDFVIFPPRWMVAEGTFRPPWYHRNVMSEFMGLICGEYDAKKAGFEPGGMSLHNAMVPHGPEAGVFEGASNAQLAPNKLENTMAFMFESRYVIQPTLAALESPHLQIDYADCWQGLQRHFQRLMPH
ncbi:MAG: homogentisate 1,2-dioxygenase [Gammaproteobacteria bacterium]|nr:homogentisate 1,2-dioxygenase [Gammaproteobacteria bacterium]